MATVHGRITDRLEALVVVRLTSGKEIECLVDTGASCALVLPQSIVTNLGLPTIGHARDIEMVGGETTSADLALAQIDWLGRTLPVEVIVRDDYILGTELLNNARLEIDYRLGTVAISRE